VAWNAQQIEFNDGGGAFTGSIAVSTTHDYDSTFGIVMPYVMSSPDGAFVDTTWDIQGMLDGLDPAYSVFASQSTNTFGNDAVTPDSMLYGMIAFSGALLPGTYTNTLEVFLKDVEGIIAIDSLFLPPANELTYNVKTPEQVDTTIFPTYSPGCFAVTIIRNLAPSVSCPVTAVGPIIFGDPVSIPGFSFTDPDDAPGPYTFSVVSSSLDGTPASPTNAPGFTGDTFEWQTSNADEADVGVWEFCVVVNDGNADSRQPCCFTVEVIAQVPVVCFSFGCVLDVLTNADVCVPLSIDNTDDCKELGGFDLLFTYDASILTFTGLDLVGSVLEEAGWEYFTYRIVSTNPAKIRVVAIADINNSNQHPDDLCLDGLLANVCFRTTADQNAGCQSALVQFCWDDCGDNTASSPDGNSLYIITDPNGSTPWAGGDPAQDIKGGGIIGNSCGIIYQLATFDGGTTGPAGFPCPNPDTTKPTPEECLYFVNGKVTIICPGEIDDRGDLNLNGLAYEIADAVLYSNYFIMGPSVFTLSPAGQTAASDVNADGTPLTVADLVYLIRVITGDATPIPGDILGGGPKVAATVGSLDIVATQQGSHVSISSTSELDMGAGLFVFNYENIDIASVTAVDRASNMDVSFQANNGELRVLVYNIEDGSKVAAGSGEILSISANGLGSIELVSVEAATFMGGMLETNLKTTVLPTAYALHQNYPNPFNPSTSLAIDLPKATDYTLSVFNIAGQLVKSFSGQAEAGTLNIVWNGSNNSGTSVASGVYFYNFRSADFNAVRKMVMMK
jgi:hypothetical protein